MSTDQERYEMLVTKAVDGMITDEERQALEVMLNADPERAAEYADFLSIKTETDAMTQRILQSAQVAPPRESRGTKVGLNLSFGLIFAALAGLIAIEGCLFFAAPDVPMSIKVIGGIFGAGFAGLFFHVLRARLVGLKNDPYQEIDR